MLAFASLCKFSMENTTYRSVCLFITSSDFFFLARDTARSFFISPFVKHIFNALRFGCVLFCRVQAAFYFFMQSFDNVDKMHESCLGTSELWQRS